MSATVIFKGVQMSGEQVSCPTASRDAGGLRANRLSSPLLLLWPFSLSLAHRRPCDALMHDILTPPGHLPPGSVLRQCRPTIPHEERGRGAHLPSLGHELAGG